MTSNHVVELTILIERWQAGEEYAAAALYERHRGLTFRLAYGILGNKEDAEEVAQDTLNYALINIHRFDPERASFNTWLHTIAVSRCRDRLRRKRLPRISLTLWRQSGGDVVETGVGPEGAAAAAETRSDVLSAVHNLKPALREAILLRYWAGHTYREMAEILSCPVPTAQSRVRLAYQQLRGVLDPTQAASLEGVASSQ